MSQIDYNDLDGSPSVARRGAGVGTKVAMVGFGLLIAGALSWINWPRSPASSDIAAGSEEDFNPPEFRSPGMSEAPQQADKAIDQIVVPPPAEGEDTTKQADNVDQTVQPGQDLDAQRRAIEAEMAADAARRKAEEAESEKKLWERLRSNQMVTTDQTGSGGAEQAPAQAEIAADGQIIPVPGADIDPNKAFLAQSESSSRGMAKARVFRRTDAMIAEGTMIRGFLETAINTDLPGMVRAVVREDVPAILKSVHPCLFIRRALG